MQKIKLIALTFFFLFSSNYLLGQSEVVDSVRNQAELVSKVLMNGDYESLVKYTHPIVIEKSGGKEIIVEAIKTTMEGMKNEGFVISSVEILDSIIVSKYEDQYHSLVPKLMKFEVDNSTIISKSYLFGFSDMEGKNWTFVEAESLASEEGSIFFPDFKTNINIPQKPQPIIIEDTNGDNKNENREINITLSWEKIDIKKRHDLEKLIDEKLRKDQLGFCSGGENGKDLKTDLFGM